MMQRSRETRRAVDGEIAAQAAGRLHRELGVLFEHGSRRMDQQLLEEITTTMVGAGIPAPLADAVRARVQARFSGQDVELYEALTVIKCQL